MEAMDELRSYAAFVRTDILHIQDHPLFATKMKSFGLSCQKVCSEVAPRAATVITNGALESMAVGGLTDRHAATAIVRRGGEELVVQSVHYDGDASTDDSLAETEECARRYGGSDVLVGLDAVHITIFGSAAEQMTAVKPSRRPCPWADSATTWRASRSRSQVTKAGNRT